jgi:hypothetical protein
MIEFGNVKPFLQWHYSYAFSCQTNSNFINRTIYNLNISVESYISPLEMMSS